MFLNKKALTKIWLLVGGYLLVATFCFLNGIVFAIFEMECTIFFILGSLCLVLTPLFYKLGRYAEGKGKLISKGNRLVFHQLRPAEFIRLYEEKRNDPGNVISKPDYDVLQLLLTAYDAQGDKNRALETVEQMITIAPAKKINVAKLLKASLLFDSGRFDEAEAIYRDVVNGKMDIMSKALADAVMKSDRALALGDDTTAESFSRQALTQTFPKPTPLSMLSAHYHLAGICYRTGRMEEAQEHRKYCIENGGETAIQQDALKGVFFQ